MTKHEENKITMYKGVLQFLEGQSTIYAGITAMSETVSEFSNAVAKFNTHTGDLREITKGITAGKETDEDKLITAVLKLANLLFIYARRNNDEELKHETNTSRSRLNQIRDTELANKARLIINKCETLITELTGYGITQEFVDNAKIILADYETSIGKQQEKYAEKSMQREALSNLFNQADEILNDELDLFMEMFVDTEVDFYNEYKSARAIRDLGHRSKVVEENN